jgi:hypothetical protein
LYMNKRVHDAIGISSRPRWRKSGGTRAGSPRGSRAPRGGHAFRDGVHAQGALPSRRTRTRAARRRRSPLPRPGASRALARASRGGAPQSEGAAV